MENQSFLTMNEQYFRTFIAIPLIPGRRFLEHREALMNSFSGARISWVDPGNYHITLRFLGDTKQSAIPGIIDALNNGMIIPETGKLNLSVLGSFGPRKKPRVIWIGFEDDGFIASLKGEVDRVLASCDLPLPDQIFRAHLTLGRVRSVKDLKAFYTNIDLFKDKFSEELTVNKLVYFRSELGKNGAKYTPLKEWSFKI
jgi:2'-5' RNA ligase